MRIIFIGVVQFSRACLETILKCGGNVVGIFTLPKEDAGFHSDYADLSFVAKEYGVPLFWTRQVKDPETIEQIRRLKPDVIFVFGWSQLLPVELLQLPPKGCIGTHPALLPKNRGRHPLVWSLVEGLSEGGLTFFYLDEGTDSGDILWQERFSITLEDDAATLQAKIMTLARKAIPQFLPLLEKNQAPRVPQDATRATHWRKRGEKDGEIDWRKSSMEIHNLVRALTRPYVGAHTFVAGKKLLVWKTQLPQEPLPQDLSALSPGTVFSKTDRRLLVRTGDGFVALNDYDFDVEPGVQLGGVL